MRRREFIRLLGGTAACWPSIASAQSERVRRFAVLMGIAETDPAQKLMLSALREGLQSLGWVEGRNLQIDVRWGAGDAERIKSYAEELVASKPDLIVGHTSPVVAALLKQTHTVPIVFTQVSDPIGSGFVAKLAQPGANATGFTNLEASMSAKLMGMLKEVAPSVTRMALLFNPDTAPDGGAYFLGPAQAACATLHVELVPAPVRNAAEIDTAVARLARQPGGGLIVMPDVFILAHRDQIIELADHDHLPAIYAYRLFAEKGGLMSYGTDLVDLFRHAAPYVDRILKGATPAELPVQQPTKFELVINLKAAKSLGLTISDSFTLRADALIE